MNEIEMRARELLAAEYTRDGLHMVAAHLRSGRLNPELGWVRDAERAARAIIAALTPPEGYVLWPILPTYQMAGAMGVKWESGEGFPLRYAAMLAVRPEVKP